MQTISVTNTGVMASSYQQTNNQKLIRFYLQEQSYTIYIFTVQLMCTSLSIKNKIRSRILDVFSLRFFPFCVRRFFVASSRSCANSFAFRNSPAAWATPRWDEYTSSYTFSQSLSVNTAGLHLHHTHTNLNPPASQWILDTSATVRHDSLPLQGAHKTSEMAVNYIQWRGALVLW